MGERGHWVQVGASRFYHRGAEADCLLCAYKIAVALPGWNPQQKLNLQAEVEGEGSGRCGNCPPSLPRLPVDDCPVCRHCPDHCLSRETGR